MKNVIVGALALATLAGAASAAQVTVGGVLSTSTGGVGPLAVNSNGADTFSASGNGFSVNGLVQYTSTVIGGTQVLTLVLTNFTFSVTGSQNQDSVLTVNIIQDYTIGAPGAAATGSHQFNGNSTGTRNGSLSVASTHEATNLPVISDSWVGTDPTVGANQGSTTNVAIIGGVYTINTTYTFTFNAGTGTGAIILPDSGVDNATLTLVPLPPAAFAGMGGLALAGFAAMRRRNQNRA